MTSIMRMMPMADTLLCLKNVSLQRRRAEGEGKGEGEGEGGRGAERKRRGLERWGGEWKEEWGDVCCIV